LFARQDGTCIPGVVNQEQRIGVGVLHWLTGILEMQRHLVGFFVEQQLEMLSSIKDLVGQLGKQRFPQMLGDSLAVQLRKVLLFPNRILHAQPCQSGQSTVGASISAHSAAVGSLVSLTRDLDDMHWQWQTASKVAHGLLLTSESLIAH
jgi:hypothetical protein